MKENRKLVGALLALPLTLGIGVVGTTSAHAEEEAPDPGYDVCTTGCDFTSIQDAADAADAGD